MPLLLNVAVRIRSTVQKKQGSRLQLRVTNTNRCRLCVDTAAATRATDNLLTLLLMLVLVLVLVLVLERSCKCWCTVNRFSPQPHCCFSGSHRTCVKTGCDLFAAPSSERGTTVYKRAHGGKTRGTDSLILVKGSAPPSAAWP